jgi:copper transport protein
MAGTVWLRRRANRTLALVAAAAASVVVPLALALPASAHATLIGSDPVDGASLASAPTTVVLHFDEDILLAATHADIVDDTPGATAAPAVPLVISGARPGATARDVVAQLPTLESGAYEVRWRAVSASDLHETHGTVVFGLGTNAGPSVAVADQWPSFWPTFFAWLQLAAFAVMAGSIAIAWLLLGRMRADDDWRGLVRARLVRLAFAAVLVATYCFPVSTAGRRSQPCSCTTHNCG